MDVTPTARATPDGGTGVRPMTRADVRRTAQLHADALPPSFFSRLGPWFLRAYHETYVSSPFAVAIVTTDASGVTGFLVGPWAARDHGAWTVRHRGVRLALLAGLAMLRRPGLARWFARTRVRRYARGIARRLGHRGTGAAGVAGGQHAVLSHTAVDARRRGSGAGTLLVRAFVDETARRGAPTVELVTAAGDAGAAGFYDRLGFRFVGERADDERSWLLYRWDSVAPSPAGS